MPSTIASPAPVATPAQTIRAAPPLFRQAPLLPIAGACTAGILLDRYVGVTPAIIIVGLGGATLAAWALRTRRRYALAALWFAALWLGAGRHYLQQQRPADDVSHFATPNGQLVRLRGIVLDGFTPTEVVRPDPLRSRSGGARGAGVIDVTQRWHGDGWQPASGRVRLTVSDGMAHVNVGDDVSFTGMLHAPEGPGNPGERDLRQAALDQGVSGSVHLDNSAGVIVQGWHGTWRIDPWLARLRDHVRGVLERYLAPEHASIAKALLLGDQRALEPEALEAYRRTGVLQVLAISGQHLAILCGAFTFRFFGLLPYPVLHLVGLSRRRVIWLTCGFVTLYTMLTGSQPPILRAAIMVNAWCLAVAFRRHTQVVNSLALAWLVLAMFNPADLLQIGCLLSFLGTLALHRAGQWLDAFWIVDPHAMDPLDSLLLEARPWWDRLARTLCRWAVSPFFASAIITAMAWPVFASAFHLCSPISLVLGPVLVVLTACALFGCFFLLLASVLSTFLADGIGQLLNYCFDACAWCVQTADAIPGGHWYVASLPMWWVLTWAAGVLLVLLWPGAWVWRRWWVLGAMAWTSVLMAWPASGPTRGELRCALLDVGHGACAVLELPDGRVMLYDAGAITGPEVTAQRIAPYLWHRGITRIDEIFLSHADLDHFNGLPALLERFHVGQVSLTPSFHAKREPGVQLIVQTLEARGVTTRQIHAPQDFEAGLVSIRVLHPPPNGPEGTENARSLTMLVTYQNRSVLLTGDLATPGLEQVMLQPLRGPVDVLLAPHHGSSTSNTEAFARWAHTGLAVSSEGRERGRRVDPYAAVQTELWRTSEEGAVTVRIVDGMVEAEGYRHGRRWTAQ